MARHQYDPDEAFDMLKIRSQHENRKLRDIAASVVAETAGSAAAGM